MSTFFLICAIAGGTLLVLRFVLGLLGLGADLVGDVVDLPQLHHGDVGHVDDMGVDHHDDGMSGLAKRLTFQGVVAFVTFFGVGGLSAMDFGWPDWAVALTAGATGGAATVLLGSAFGGLRKLQGSGSLRLSNAVGEVGRVYLRIPGGDGGVGKVFVPIQGRCEEVRATTPGPELRPGEAVVVTRAIDDRTLEVVAQAAYVAKAAPLAD